MERRLLQIAVAVWLWQRYVASVAQRGAAT